MTTQNKSTPKELNLFESTAARPQWERLPQAIKIELLQLLREMLLSRPAREQIQRIQKGGVHE